jgi:LemA protein
MNLIPNFVETIKSYAPHEQEVLGAVTQLHIKAAVTMLQPQRIAINSELTAALDRLSTVAERYPDLKADQSFMRLRDELASIETSIAEETITYNEAARKYNTYAAGFPVVIVATLSGFAQAPLYEAQGLPRSGVESPLPLPGNR